MEQVSVGPRWFLGCTGKEKNFPRSSSLLIRSSNNYHQVTLIRPRFHCVSVKISLTAWYRAIIDPLLFLRNNSQSLFLVPPFLVTLPRAPGGVKWGEYRGALISQRVSSRSSFSSRAHLPPDFGGQGSNPLFFRIPLHGIFVSFRLEETNPSQLLPRP